MLPSRECKVAVGCWNCIYFHLAINNVPVINVIIFCTVEIVVLHQKWFRIILSSLVSSSSSFSNVILMSMFPLLIQSVLQLPDHHLQQWTGSGESWRWNHWLLNYSFRVTGKENFPFWKMWKLFWKLFCRLWSFVCFPRLDWRFNSEESSWCQLWQSSNKKWHNSFDQLHLL